MILQWLSCVIHINRDVHYQLKDMVQLAVKQIGDLGSGIESG